MIPLKKNFTYLILNKNGQINGKSQPGENCRESGAYLLDTRVLNQYEWNLDGFSLLHTEYLGSRRITQYFSKFENHKQSLLITRRLEVLDGGFRDELVIANDDIEEHAFHTELSLDSDFVDMFEVRGHAMVEDVRDVHQHHSSQQFSAHYVDSAGTKTSIELILNGFRFHENIHIGPRSREVLCVEARFESDLEVGNHKLLVPENWLIGKNSRLDIYRQAELDLHDLLLATEHGTTIAAGIPWFVTPFGRDSIIASWLLLKPYPELAKGTLKFLAANQGTKLDRYRDEQPGKILHEQRYAELSRLGKLPFLTYYGTADATPLFVVLLHDYCREVKDYSLIEELKENWQAALGWLEHYKNDHGLIVFYGNSSGLTVQSWKDSHDSLSYSDGRLGEGAIAVAEVQGYCYAAYKAAAHFYNIQGDSTKAGEYLAKAEELQQTFDDLFWMPSHSNYAIALDENGKQLDINSSDSGHLLWSGIVPAAKVDPLIKRLFEEDLWSGWGLRTLSTKEARYNPISYHNGSVWPHDTAMFAAGLKLHGKKAEFEKIKQALMEVASGQKDKRLPELFSGYPKGELPVLPYIEACRPQAWSSAALIYLINDGENAK